MKKYISLLIFVTLLFVMLEPAFANKGRKFYEQAGQILWDINTDEKVIALTFDDGFVTISEMMEIRAKNNSGDKHVDLDETNDPK
ncbi:hypothetical protein NSQ43_07935 [Sporosarcina sp. FSL W8-0480]|uniref:hypothetical protein n=1 Tax=Sporosarcina sp. FSL W8-0480 TaxID=2954701 RepID=UPI0030D9CEF3